MPEDFITTREFDGFTESIRGEIRQLSETVIGVGGKLDALILKSNEEARAMGELTATIKAILVRLEAAEKQIGEIKKYNEEHTDGKLKWIATVAGYIISAIVGGIVSAKLLK